jgi:hypothetical protein
MTSVVTTLAHTLAPWQSLYSNSKAVATTVTSVHLTALLFGGGFAVAADRATLRAGQPDRTAAQRVLAELHGVHRPVLVALTILFVSGVALAAADVETFAKSPAFLVKLGLVALLVLNGLALTRTERELRRLEPQSDAPDASSSAREVALWRRLRTTAWLSLALWAATVVSGTVLVNAA